MKNSPLIFVIIILASILISFTGSRIITGRVTDEMSQPLAGVSVIIKGSQTGTRTDSNGNYKLTVGENERFLIFSLSGFKTEEVRIDSRNAINVIMKLISREKESQKIFASERADN